MHGIHRLFSHHVHMALMTKLDPCHCWAHRLYRNHSLIRGLPPPTHFPSKKKKIPAKSQPVQYPKNALAPGSEDKRSRLWNVSPHAVKMYFRPQAPAYSTNYSSLHASTRIPELGSVTMHSRKFTTLCTRNESCFPHKPTCLGPCVLFQNSGYLRPERIQVFCAFHRPLWAHMRSQRGDGALS